MAFDHHADDPLIPARNLARDVAADVNLAHIILLAVGMTEIDHHALREAGRG